MTPEIAAAQPLKLNDALPVDGQQSTYGIPYDLIFENAIVGICFMQDRTFLKINSRMEELFGYTRDELNGKAVRPLYASEEDYQIVGKIIASFAQNNRYVHERQLVKKNGEIFWCMISGSSVNPSDPASPSVWVVQDINARKLVENALSRSRDRLEETVERRTLNLQRSNRVLKEEVARRRESEKAMVESREKFRAMFRNIPLGIFITDDTGAIIEINPSMTALTGLTLSELGAIANDASCIIGEFGEELSLTDLIRLKSPVSSRQIGRSAVKWRLASGAVIDVDVVAVRLTVKGLGSAFLFEDKTERRRAREREHDQQLQLAHASRLSLMGQFASALAHELGQPLNASRSYVAGVKNRLTAVADIDDDVIDALERIDLHLCQAGDVIANVRAFVSRHRPEDSEIDIAHLIRQTVNLLKMHLHSASVQVLIKESITTAMVRGNRVELQQVIINLIMNAIDAMAETVIAERLIEIRLKPDGPSHISLRVIDRGPGVPSDLRLKIFDPYFTTKPSGIGLGLMMCRTIIESHGGTLKLVNSQRSGAIFKVLLPIA